MGPLVIVLMLAVLTHAVPGRYGIEVVEDRDLDIEDREMERMMIEAEDHDLNDMERMMLEDRRFLDKVLKGLKKVKEAGRKVLRGVAKALKNSGALKPLLNLVNEGCEKNFDSQDAENLCKKLGGGMLTKAVEKLAEDDKADTEEALDKAAEEEVKENKDEISKADGAKE